MSEPTETVQTSEPSSTDSVLRRTVLKAGAVTVGALGMGVPVTAQPSGQSELASTESSPDSPEGFSVEVLAGHATFPDDVAARFRMNYGSGTKTVVSNLPRDASSVIVAKVTWAPEGTSGWHTHPGPVIVSVAEGELELVNDRDCVARTYTAGEAFIDPGQGNVHVASNPSTTDQAVAYATFLGVPMGTPATVWVPPVDCQ
jgi:quercetin dioxygenase-like cupin family protein